MHKIKLTVILITILSLPTFAQDRYFARAYTSNILPKGAIDLEISHTSRFGHKDQFFHAQDQRMELEIGLGKNVQTAIYFNRYQQRYSESANGTNTSNEIGFSNEWKWKLSDPVANKLGFALYGEWGLKGGDELEFEGKFIIDKNIGKNILAFNAVLEYEKEFEWLANKVNTNNWNASVEINFGYQYLLKTNLGIGFEIVDHNDITKTNSWVNSVLYGGPTLNFRHNKWFIIANYLPQWSNLHKTTTSPFSKVLDQQEKVEARFIVGFSF